MRIKIFKLFVFILIILKNFYALSEAVPGQPLQSQPSIANPSTIECNDVPDKKTLINGWYTNIPYQYITTTPNGNINVAGMDIELINAFAKKAEISIVKEENNWFQNQLDIEQGTLDMASGATYTIERSEYAYFSKPYRSEELSLFIIDPLAKKLNFQNINQFMAQIRLFNLHLGVIKGNVYGLPEFTDFLQSEKNSDIITVYQNDMELVNGLMTKEIDGFVSDRIVGAVNILNAKVEQKITEVPLNIKTPIHLMFSKKTVSLNVVQKFNYAIDAFITSNEYKKITKTYLYHILLPKSIDSRWCHIIVMIGSLAFAVSGIIIGAKNNTTLFGTFLFAILPSISSCIILDLIVNHDTGHLNFDFTPFYFYYVFISVLISFTAIKLFSSYNKQVYEDSFLDQVFINILAICDAFGQASFVVIGIVMIIIQKIEPLGFWGPFFACITANSGVIFRDFISGGQFTKGVPKGLTIEISILWGVCFSVLLDIYGSNPDYNTIEYSMMAVIAGAFFTHLLVYYFSFPEWRFRNDKITEENTAGQK
ncbi:MULTISPECIES: transporter substrate-binding domain-containing protein [unclassified Rickettsia]|uniref:transporter substrate-binding domain-containing protein n=1 Tax=Rickettsia endosymbiont of Aspidapion aeneum TaxID=3066247 RepID=UPI00209C9573|nr:transporter substrate-binding domain-containing protein [Rickettsia endosymbiont of Ceutorhynchus assimilis]